MISGSGASASGGVRVLVVDDEPVIGEILTDTLAVDGHAVETAPDGARALARLGAERFDVVLSDVHMPGMDGMSLYRAVAELHPGLARRFILITGSSLTAAARQFLEETGVPVLEKPFDLRAVRAIVREVLAAVSAPC